MKRVITSLSLLLLLLCGAVAQNINQYECWTDDDYAHRSVVNSSGGNISLSVSTATLTAGIHFLNFRACRSDGVWGNFYRYLYYIPTITSPASGEVQVKYWLDDNLEESQTEMADEGNLSLAIDISTLSPGIHYFNCTPIAATGEMGSSERYLFYVPQSFDIVPVSPIKGYEYWLDDNYSGKTVNQSSAANPVFAVNIDGLSSGVHYFNCRVFNERGEYGNPVRKMFYIPRTDYNPDAQLASAEYWLDDDYSNKVSVQTSNTNQSFTIDVSQLSSGVHYFNYRAFDSDGRAGTIVREMFYLAQSQDVVEAEYLEYEYWIDDNTADKVTGTGVTAEYMFSIDISSLSAGIHTFNFRAKNVLDQWSETFVEEFNVEPCIVNKLTLANLEGKRNNQVVMPIGLTNETPITGLQFDLYLPNGVTVATKSNGKMMIETTDRMDENYTITGNLMDGYVRIVGYSGDGDAFTGNRGDILNVTLDISNDIDVGEHPIYIKDIVLSDVVNTEYHPADVESKLTIESYTLGDVDNSGAININDVVCIINYILNRPVETFIIEAADVDGNGSININDVVMLINKYILMRDNAPALIESSDMMEQEIVMAGQYLNLTDLDISPGETKEIQLIMTNANEVAAMQGNIKLPAGLSFITSSDGGKAIQSDGSSFACAVQADGSMTFVQYFTDGRTFDCTENTLTFKVKAAENAVSGKYSIVLSDAMLSINGVGYEVPVYTSTLIVAGTTGIDNVQSALQFDVYSLNGQKLLEKVSTTKGLPKGIYIINGKKVTVK